MNGEQKPNGSRRKRRERLFIPPPAVGLRGRPATEAGASSVLREYISEEEQQAVSQAGQETLSPGAVEQEEDVGAKEVLSDEWETEAESLRDDEAETRRLKLIELRLDRLERRISDFENTCYSFLLHAKRLSDRAVSFYEDVFGLSREDLAHIHDRLGINYNNNGHYEKAIESFRRVVEFDDRNASAHFKLGVACDNAGNYREAIDCYRKAISLDPKYLKAYYKLADIYVKNESHEEAIRCLARAVELSPHNAETHYRLGEVHSNQGNYNEAIASYFRVIEIAPGYPGIYRSLGLAYERKGEHDKAIECFKKSV